MKKHILFFIESLSGGGAEKVLVTLLKHLDYSRYEMTLLTLVDTGVLRGEVDMSKLHYKPVIREAKSLWQHIWNRIKYKLIYQYLPCEVVNRWIIPQNGIDVYIAFTEGFATKLLSYMPKKKFAWVHADLQTDPWTLKSHIYRDFSEEQKVYNRYDKVACVSKTVEKVMKDYYGLKSTITIYNPIDKYVILQKAKPPIDIKLPSSFKIVSVGRLVYQKGYDRLISVIGKLRQEGKDVQLYIIGEGSERKHLESLIHNQGLKEVVHLVGFLNNPYALMSKMDLFVCSSIAEGFSLVIAEAMILGLPVLSTDCAGPNELLDHGNFGILVDNDETKFYEGLHELIDNSVLLDHLKQKSLERSQSFGIANTINAFDDLVESF